jgi:hypothetical protein
MTTLLATFGDSWTYGSELEDPQTESWTAQLGTEFDQVYNMGTPASSIGHMAVQLEMLLHQVDINKFSKRVFVFGLTSASRYLMFDNLTHQYVNVTSEAVYYTDINGNGRPPTVVEHLLKFSWDFYRDVEHAELQKYTSSQTVAFLQGWCSKHRVQDIYLSYFEDQKFNQFVDLDKIINQGRALNLDRQYFTEGKSHPNKQGHACIASVVKEYL